MDKVRKQQLIQRSLGLRHKLKVLESMKQPETHEDLAVSLIAKWEYEDEMHAIEELLAEARRENVQGKKKHIEKLKDHEITPRKAEFARTLPEYSTTELPLDHDDADDNEDNNDEEPLNKVASPSKKKKKN